MSTFRLAAGGLLFLGTLALPTAGGAKPGDRDDDRAETVPVAIHEIQGSGLRSPLVDMDVVTQGIVTARTSEGFFIQTPDDATDGLAETSEGLFVRVDSLQMGPAQIGSHLGVQGRVREIYPYDNPHQLTFTELTDVQSITVRSTDQPLPAPITLSSADLASDGDHAALERLEGMRVRAAELVVVGPTQSYISPASQTVWPDGSFYAMLGLSIGNDALPFREPGLPPLEAGTPPAGKDLPIRGGNPQILAIEAGGQRGSINRDLQVGLNDRLRNVVGVLGYRGARYALLTDAQVPLAVETGYRGEGAAFISPGEVKLVWMDLGDLYDASDDPARDEPVHPPAVYQARLGKIARGLCTFMLNPEVIAVGSVENVQVLEDLAALIETNATGYCPEPRQYEAVLVEGNDASGLDLGFLVAGYPVDGMNPRVQVLSAETFAAADTSAHPDGGSEPLFTRPPLAVALQVTDEGGRQARFTALNVRLHEAWDANNLWLGANGWSTGGDRVMTLRARQAARIAAWIEDRQQADPNEAIAVLGGFEADAFNDGRVDVMGIVTGRPAPANQTWVATPSPITTPLANLTELAPAYTRYNANEFGEFRALDHIVVNEAMRRRFAITSAHPRMNADFPASARAAGDPGFTFSARDPLMARLAVAAFIDADTRVEIYSEGTFSPRVDNIFYLGVTNLGPQAAPALELVIESSLAPSQWSLSTEWPGWTCGEVTAKAGGSRVTCSNPRLVESHGFEIRVPADLSLDGGSATFTANLSGGHNDPDTSNNQSSRTFTFDARVDLSVQLQSTDGLEDLLPGTSGGWIVIVERSPLNPPGPVAITLDIDAPAGDVTLTTAYSGVDCDAGTATGPRSSRFNCTVQNDDFLQVAVFGVAFSTGLGDGRRVIGLRAEAQSGTTDATPDDNVAVASRRVSDNVDLVALPISVSVEEAIIANDVSVVLGLRNDITGVARNARVEILVDVAPADLGAVETQTFDGTTPDVWTCSAPVADGAGSRVSCAAPALLEQPALRPRNYYFVLRLTTPFRPGLASYPINVSLSASSDSEEQVPADNSASATFTVDQTSNLQANVNPFGSPVVEPGLAMFATQVYSTGRNLPRNPRVRLALNAVFAPADLVVKTLFGQTVTCTPDSAPVGSTAVVCPVDVAYPTLNVSARTNPDLAFTTLALQATAINDLVDVVPSDDVASGSVEIIAQADLCVGPGCRNPPRQMPLKLLPDQLNSIMFDLSNRGPSTARSAVAIITLTLEASRVTAFPATLGCSAATDIGGGRSEVRCALGDLRGDGFVRQLMVNLDLAGLLSGDVSIALRIESGTPDPQPGNDAYVLVLPIAPVVDLSAQVTAKRSEFPGPATFSIVAAADGPPVAANSQLDIRIESPGAGDFANLVMDGPGWLCSPTTYELDLQEWICGRWMPIAPGTPSVIGVEVPAHRFIQIGRPIRVVATHRYRDDALAIDRTPGNNTAIGSHVVDGRSTQSTSPSPKPTPAYGTQRQPEPTSLRAPARRNQTR